MYTLTQITSSLLITITHNDTVKEIVKAVAIMELEETISNMCGGGS